MLTTQHIRDNYTKEEIRDILIDIQLYEKLGDINGLAYLSKVVTEVKRQYTYLEVYAVIKIVCSSFKTLAMEEYLKSFVNKK